MDRVILRPKLGVNWYIFDFCKYMHKTNLNQQEALHNFLNSEPSGDPKGLQIMVTGILP